MHTPSSSGNDTTSAYLVNITQATIVGNELFLAVIPQGNQKLSLIVIPKLTCQNGTLTVPAQRINGTSTNTPARFQLNFGSMTKNVSSCQQLCIYSFVRAQIQGSNIIDNFKADTWCGTVDEAMAIAGSDAFSAIIHGNNAIIMVSLNIALTFIFRWLGYWKHKYSFLCICFLMSDFEIFSWWFPLTNVIHSHCLYMNIS